MAGDAEIPGAPLYFQVSDPPIENHFLADDTVACQVLLASPLPHYDRLQPEVHRLIFAWPEGNSAGAVFFQSTDTGTSQLRVALKKDSDDAILKSISHAAHASSPSKTPSVGVSGTLSFSASASLNLSILGSVRTVRDYTEGHGILNTKVQEGIRVSDIGDHQSAVNISRTWFDAVTTTNLTLRASSETAKVVVGDSGGLEVTFSPGLYTFEAHYNFPQTSYLHPIRLLKPAYHDLLSQQPKVVKSLSFLCSARKVLAGAWRFFTYFGRDSMISLMLLSPVLSEGEHGTMELGLSAVLERVNREDGSVCHEENIGDYPAAQAALEGRKNYGAEYDYKMIDTDFFLPILMKRYFIDSEVGRQRLHDFLSTPATLIAANASLSYRDLLALTCLKIVRLAKPFACKDSSLSFRDLIALKEKVPVGQWRDSNDGLGGGRYPYDVNTALMPAALRAIGELARAHTFTGEANLDVDADQYAVAWEKHALQFFKTVIPKEEAQRRLQRYVAKCQFPGPSNSDQLVGDLAVHAIALGEDGSPVEVLHTDAGFRLFFSPHLIHSSDLDCALEHLSILDNVADLVLRTFPAGLFTRAGVLIANPAFSSDPSHTKAFSSGAYHGTVVWTWNSLALLAKGLEVQLSVFSSGGDKTATIPKEALHKHDPQQYTDVWLKLKKAYTRVWNAIDSNKEHLSAEVWSWKWDENADGQGKGDFVYVPLSHQPTPDGSGQTESNAVQLWSLTLLALERKKELEA